MVQLVGPVSNFKICTFMFHSILYYYFMSNIRFQQIYDIFMKTINFVRCLRPIDNKYVRSISYGFIYLNSNGL